MRRFLADEPIVARPASAMYQFRKFARRNRFLVGGAAAALLGLLDGLATAGWGLRQAVVQRRVAEGEATRARTEAARYEQIARFTQGILAGINPEVAKGKDTSLMEAILADAERRMAAELDGYPEVEAVVRHMIGLSYLDLGRFDPAEPHLRTALALFEKAGIEDPAAMDARNTLAVLCYQTGRYDEAEAPSPSRSAGHGGDTGQPATWTMRPMGRS